MKLTTGNSFLSPSSRAVQLVKCLSCEKYGVFWYEEESTQAAWLHRGYALSQETRDKLFARLERCPDKVNKLCKCETHACLTTEVEHLGVGEDIQRVYGN